MAKYFLALFLCNWFVGIIGHAEPNTMPLPGPYDAFFELIREPSTTTEKIAEYLKTNPVPVNAEYNGVTPLAQTIIWKRQEIFRYLFDYYKRPSLNKKISSEIYMYTLYEYILIQCPLDWIDFAKAAGGKIDPKKGGNDLIVAARKNTLPVIQELIRRGNKVNSHNNDGITPLMEAAAANTADVISELLAHQADIRAKDKDNETVLFKVVYQPVEIFKLLVAAHADLNARDKWGRTPLLALGSSSPELFEAMLMAGADINAVEKDGDTIFMGTSNDADYFRVLLAHHADPNRRNKSGETALNMLALSGSSKAESAKVLLDAKVDVNSRNKFGASPLVKCALGCTPEFIQVLLDAGADKCIRAEDGTAVEQALHYERPGEIVAMLWSDKCPPRRKKEVIIVSPVCHLELIGMVWQTVCN